MVIHHLVSLQGFLMGLKDILEKMKHKAKVRVAGVAHLMLRLDSNPIRFYLST